MSKVIKSSMYITLGFFLSRLLGLLRDFIVSAQWGASESSDIALTIMNFPDLVASLLIGTAITALLTPYFIQDKSEANRNLYSRSATALSLYGAIASLLIYFFNEPISILLVPGLSAAAMDQTGVALKVISITILFTFIASVPRAFLISKEFFKITAFENVFFNIPLVTTLFFFVSADNLYSISLAVFAATLVRMIYLLVSAHGIGARWKWQKLTWNSSFIRRFIALNITSGCAILLFYLLRAQATHLGAGQLTIFTYFFKILELPLGVLTTIIFTIALPKLASGAVVNNSKILKNILWISLACAVLGALFFKLLMGQNLTFYKVNANDIDLLLEILIVGTFSAPARLVITYLQSMEYAKSASRKSLITNLIALAISIVALFLFKEKLSLQVFAWILNLYYFVNAITLYTVIKNKA